MTQMFTVVVPATTANLGPGYDTIGLALDLQMEVSVYEATTWSIRYEQEEYRALDGAEENLIIQTALNVAKAKEVQLPPLALVVSSNIPLGKGLGSSASAIAAGIEVANEVASLHLSLQEKLEWGSRLEGHADNVNAAIAGGLVLSYYKEDELDVVRMPAPTVGALVLVPDAQLATSESRGVLPNTLDHAEATAGSAAGTLFVGAIAQQNWELAGKMLERDTFHEPYRKGMFPHFDDVRELVKEHGAYGMTISGAGPSLFVIAPVDRTESIAEAVRSTYDMYHPIITHPSNQGAIIQ